MGIGHVRDILETSVEWQSSSQKLIAVVMAYASDRKGVCHITQTELAEQTALSVRRVADLVDSLCDLEVMVRLGHGRYGVRFGLPVDGRRMLPQPKGVDAELERLNSIKQPGQGIAYTPNGWPVLVWRHNLASVS